MIKKHKQKKIFARRNRRKLRTRAYVSKRNRVLGAVAVIFIIVEAVVWMLRRLGILGRIYAIEPLRNLYDCTKENAVSLFTAQLSLTFITISVMSMLSDSSVVIYWSNLVERKLIKPVWRCFYSYTIYSFATIIAGGIFGLTGFYLLFMAMFVLDICVLMFLTFSMIDVYYNHEDKKLQLKDEFEQLVTSGYRSEQLDNAKSEYENIHRELLRHTLQAFEDHDFSTVRDNLDFYAIYYEFFPRDDIRMLLKYADDIYLSELVLFLRKAANNDINYRKHVGNRHGRKFYRSERVNGRTRIYTFDPDNDIDGFTISPYMSSSPDCAVLIYEFLKIDNFERILKSENDGLIRDVLDCVKWYIEMVLKSYDKPGDNGKNQVDSTEWSFLLLMRQSLIKLILTFYHDSELLNHFEYVFWKQDRENDIEYDRMPWLYRNVPSHFNVFHQLRPASELEIWGEEEIWNTFIKSLEQEEINDVLNNLSGTMNIFYANDCPDWIKQITLDAHNVTFEKRSMDFDVDLMQEDMHALADDSECQYEAIEDDIWDEEE